MDWITLIVIYEKVDRITLIYEKVNWITLIYEMVD